MKAIQVQAGQPLAFVDTAAPTVGATDVLIDVRAAGLNRGDLMQRAGMYPPPPGASEVMGLEAAGVVTEIGRDVTEWTVGDRVCALMAGGGYAEQAVAEQGSVFPIPDSVDFAQAACFPEATMTVWANVFLRGGFKSGESILIHGGTSGIGVMAIQMAKHAGASRIMTTAGSDEKVAVCRDLGADVAINYRTEDFVEIAKAHGGADLILDIVGGDYINRNIDVANIDGRICNIAYQAGFTAEVNFMPAMLKRLVLTATTLRARTDGAKREIRDAVLADFWPAITDGTIRPIVDAAFPLHDAEAAQAHMEQGGHIGKIVLER